MNRGRSHAGELPRRGDPTLQLIYSFAKREGRQKEHEEGSPVVTGQSLPN